MFKYLTLALAMLLVIAAAGYAGDEGGRPGFRGEPPDFCRGDWGWGNVNCTQPRINVCPQGDLEPISEGCGSDDDYIWVEVVDDWGNPWAGIPVTDYWLQAIDPAEQLCLCAGSFVADSVTNSEGRTTFSGPIAAGGCALNGLYLRVRGIIIYEWPACLDVAVRDIIIMSPDLNADCRVNLSDLGVFGLSYNKSRWVDPDFNTCCDYDDDNCNLSDFAWFAEHYLHECF
jgi:hypothetical protein